MTRASRRFCRPASRADGPASDQRLLLDGRRTSEPDEGTFYSEPAEQHRNYSTNRAVLAEFARCCETCAGLRVS